MDVADEEFASLMTSSHRRLVGVPLADPARSLAEVAHWLYYAAPFGLVAHGLGPDPRFRYANRTAQRHFGYSWDEFVGLPSRLSAAAPDRAERARLLADVTRKGHSTGYRGLRIAKSGARFWIDDATVWNLVDRDGESHGQAAVFRSVKPALSLAPIDRPRDG
jgi:PAS domain S-box-containing protein